MKNFFTNIILLIALSVIFSSLTGCSSSTTTSSNSQNGSTEKAKSNTNGTTSESKKVDYPSPPAAMAQADIKMLDGSTFKLADKKGKVVLVNMWATWCGPCRAEMPALVEMQEKYKDKNFEIIGLDVDEESPGQIKEFAADMKLNYQLGWADEVLYGEFSKITKMNGIPQSILFNRDGNITGVFTGGSARVVKSMKETVEKIVNE
jgi:thiol-disulfide isomerase/thioredoxin